MRTLSDINHLELKTMFGWRKKNNGFEWHEYVRTTILVRRNARRQKIDEARQVALDGLSHAGQRGVKAGVSGLKMATRAITAFTGSVASVVMEWGRGANTGLFKGFAYFRSVGLPFAMSLVRRALGFTLHMGGRFGQWAYEWVYELVSGGGSLFWQAMIRVWRAMMKLNSFIVLRARPLMQPELALPVGVISLAASAGAVGEFLSNGLSPMFFGASSFTLVSAAFVSGCLWDRGVDVIAGQIGRWFSSLRPFAFGRFGKVGGFGNLSSSNLRRFGTVAGAALGLAGVVGAGFYLWEQTGGLTLAPHSSKSPHRANLSKVEGFAKSLTGDTVRIKGVSIRLSGIEAPELLQTCSLSSGQTWDCGYAALSALRRITGRHTVSCELGRALNSGLKTATCRIGREDIAAELVRQGHVFAVKGFFSSYASLEKKARAQKFGIWRGKAVRPKVFRERFWKIAAKKAPNGCPVKGPILSSRGKVYLMPWSRKYTRYRIRARRGERWFCSEQEALEAGWKPYRQL